MSAGVLLSLSGAAAACSLPCSRRRPGGWLAATLTAAGLAFAAAVEALLDGGAWEWRSSWKIAGEPLHLQLDALGGVFLALIGFVGAAGAAYSAGYWRDRDHPESAGRGRFWWTAMLVGMALIVLSANGVHFLIAWELFALSGYFLIALERQQAEARSAGWLYLAASHLGTLCLLAFFAGLAARTGSWDLGPMRDRAGLAPLFWLALVGFGAKAGLVPLHLWLPSAHANAPSHVSALMSGVALKMGVYGLLRFTGWLPTPPLAGWAVLCIGALGALVGMAYAFPQGDLKRLLAYCSVENVGVIATGLGAGMLAASHGNAAWGRLALAGALLHVWNHGVAKSLLFFGSGSVLHAVGTREMTRMGGLWRRMPWVAALFAVGAGALSGLPPLNGFVSEWLITLGLFEAAVGRGSVGWAAAPAAIALAVAGALALAAFVKASGIIFLGAARTEAAGRARDAEPSVRRPMLVLAGAAVLLGLIPFAVWPVLARATGAWNPAWSSPAEPALLRDLSAVQVAAAALAVAGGAWLWRRVKANGLRRGFTWDCGYAAPTARIQYTGASFSATASGWFSWFQIPARASRRPRGPFPRRALRIDRIPETVLERAVEPAGRGVLQFASAARRLQHGRLQFYVIYVLGGLAALALVAWWGRQP